MGARAAVVVLSVLAVTGWGAAAGLGAAVLALRADADPRLAAGSGAPAEDTYTLTVHDDGCGVVRTEGPDGADLDSLTWSVVDDAGFEVLGRNALGETHYRYFGGGTFAVVLEAWGGESYVPVSNTVTVSC